MEVEVINISKNPLPQYARTGDAGMDVFANVEEAVVIKAGERALIPTGLKVGIPVGYEIQVRPRSGLALKKGITVLNTPGTIDAGYRNEVGVILMNHSNEDFIVDPGDKIAQIVLKKFETIEWKEVEELGGYDRGGGFGHTDENHG